MREFSALRVLVKTFHRFVSEDGSEDGGSIAYAEPEPDEVMNVLNSCKLQQRADVWRSKRVHDVEVEVRVWKFFLLFPRMFLFLFARGGKVI